MPRRRAAPRESRRSRCRPRTAPPCRRSGTAPGRLGRAAGTACAGSARSWLRSSAASPISDAEQRLLHRLRARFGASPLRVQCVGDALAVGPVLRRRADEVVVRASIARIERPRQRARRGVDHLIELVLTSGAVGRHLQRAPRFRGAVQIQFDQREMATCGQVRLPLPSEPPSPSSKGVVRLANALRRSAGRTDRRLMPMPPLPISVAASSNVAGAPRRSLTRCAHAMTPRLTVATRSAGCNFPSSPSPTMTTASGRGSCRGSSGAALVLMNTWCDSGRVGILPLRAATRPSRRRSARSRPTRRR